MSKVTLKVEIDEETYKQIKSDSVYDNNNKIIISKSSLAYYALNAIINATSITESDDVVSRQALLEFFKDDDYVVNEINNMPSVTPKREQGEWIRADKLIKSLRDSCEGFWRKKMLINGEPLSEALSFELNTIKRCIKDLKDEESEDKG